MKKTVFIWALLFMFMGNGHTLYANGNWRDDFEKICIHTANAGNLSSKELGRLIDESDTLLKTIESIDVPEKKLYLIRLRKCRNFLVFMRGIVKTPENE